MALDVASERLCRHHDASKDFPSVHLLAFVCQRVGVSRECSTVSQYGCCELELATMLSRHDSGTVGDLRWRRAT